MIAMTGLSAIMPVAYDHAYATSLALPAVYPLVDEVILGLDADRISWSGKPFAFDTEAFTDALRAIDTRGIIKIVEDNFHWASAAPMVNDTYEHNYLGKLATPGNWLLHVDSDEILRVPDPQRFRDFLASAAPTQDVTLRQIEVFKLLPSGAALVIDRDDGFGPCATFKRDRHTMSRHTDRNEVRCPPEIADVLGFGWARTPEEIAQKVANWSHSKDRDFAAFARDVWQAADETNYHTFKNFWPLWGPNWPGLRLMSAAELGAERLEAVAA